ncbi:MAG: DEAD/DEAH box helicase family protein [Acidobacteriota bacterium]|nr:DEAD/DEAH box helicase family protein [Acidobacteriota bacterium]
MAQAVIENPVINSPFDEPSRHYRFTDEGITDEIIDGRRRSEYFMPIAQPRKRGKQMVLESEWTQDRIEPNVHVNRIRGRVAQWRAGGYQGVTSVTRRLLQHWTDPDRDHRLFFCQIEALETAIYITEVAPRAGDHWIENHLRQTAQDANPLLFRIAHKMATGSGKTVVMAMLIAWQALNKLANTRDARFSDAFLIVTPGITIRDRLRVLLPNDPHSYYREHDVVPADLRPELGKAKIIVTNYHAFLQRERVDAGKLTKGILGSDETGAFTETPDQMVRRVCRGLGNKRNIVVINDEAHHCYRHRVQEEVQDRLIGDDRKEAEQREEAARVWISGIEAVKAKLGVRTVYDLSATPFFLRGSGYSEGTLFPWVVSDFSLIDAIESGIVKVPRVPVEDDSMVGEQPTYRDLWLRIRDHLPKKGRNTEAVGAEPVLPAELQGALVSLYGNYRKYYERWNAAEKALGNQQTPPVFIVVCNNTNVSKLVFDWVAGWEKPISDDETVLVPGALELFSNVQDGRWLDRPNTLLIDSAQLESGEALSPEFRKLAATQIDEFKAEYRERFPGSDVEKLTDADILREVMNTVGKPGKLGEHIRCVVSVSMLTEGWDANTVTHILGVRAFGTQLLCEQVVGRGLRRMSYATNAEGYFDPEYAEVYGVPFSFIPCSGSSQDPKPGPMPTRVRALQERIACEITFPRVMGYRYDLPSERLEACFSEDSELVISTRDIPTRTENAPIIGESSIHDLDDLRARREQEVAFLLAKLTLEKYFRDDGGSVKPWLFPQLLRISRRWLAECVTCKDHGFPQILLLVEIAHNAADRIHRAIVASEQGAKTLKPILFPYDPVGSTRFVDFDTTRPVYPTAPEKCHVSHVVADTESWEQKLAQTLEGMPEVLRYVKNHNLGFRIPYTLDCEQHDYIPDFIVHYDDGREEPLNLIIEVTGEKKRDKEAKVATARTLWVPAVNNHGGFGRWAFIEIRDPWNAMQALRTL